MTLDDLQFLLSPTGQAWLARLAETPLTPQTHLAVAAELRQEITPSQAQAVLETAVLREQAHAKFERAHQMYFTRPALEQATAEPVARHRAQRFWAAGCRQIADLGCSIGGDALVLAQQADVTGVEWDPVRLAMAQENVRAYGRADRFNPLQADLLELTPLTDVDGLFFDPARRDERGRRFFSVHQYQPPLSLIDQWRKQTAQMAAKISPGVDYDELPPEAEVEFVSLDGEVKEAVLWYGDLHSGVKRRATLLPGGETITDANLPQAVPVTSPQSYLYEPDGAVIRAHLVTAVAAQLNGGLIDPEIAYMTAETAVVTPFARGYEVRDYFPFQLKQLRRYLRERQIGSVVVKKRGSPIDPQFLAQQLRLDKNAPHACTLFLTQVNGRHSVIVAHPLNNNDT